MLPSSVATRSVFFAPELARLLATHSGEISDFWASMLVRELGESSYASRTGEEIAAWSAAGLASIIEALESGSAESLHLYANRLGRLRLEQGFAIDEVIESLGLLRSAVFEVLLARAPDAEPLAGGLSRFDTCHRTLLRRFAATYEEGALAALKEEQERSSLMLRTAQIVGSTLDLETMLTSAAAQIADALSAENCAIYLWNEFGSKLALRAMKDDRSATRSALSQSLDVDQKPVVDAKSSRSAVVCTGVDLAVILAPRRPEELLVAEAIVVPILLGNRLVGLAVAVRTERSRTKTRRWLRLAEAVALSVAPAIENALQYESVQKEALRTQLLQTSTACLLDMQNMEDLLQIICREARCLSGSSDVAVLLDREMNGRPRSSGSGQAAGAVDELIRQSEREAETVVDLPLEEKGRRHGRLLLLAPAPFDNEKLRLLEMFASQAATAIGHALLHEQDEQVAALEERQKLAHELHDSMTQSLYAATLYSETALRLVESGSDEGVLEILRELKETTLDALRQMRLLVFELRPPILEAEGLSGALEGRLAAVEGRAGIATLFENDDGVDDLPAATADALYGIAREAMNNTLKHASASRIEICLRRTEEMVTMEITDNGVGFEPEGAANGGGLGIKGMKERAEAVAADLVVSSPPQGGTCVRVVAPVHPSISSTANRSVP